MQIIATFKKSLNPSKNKIDRSRYTEAQLKALDQQLEKSSPTIILETFSFKKPFEEFEDFPNFGFYATAFKGFDQHGTFPHEGPLDNQPNRTMEVLNLLSALRAEEETNESKKHQSRSRR